MSEEVTESLESVPTTKVATAGETVDRRMNRFTLENYKVEFRNLGYYGIHIHTLLYESHLRHFFVSCQNIEVKLFVFEDNRNNEKTQQGK